MAKDINKSEYTEGTKLKLEIFRECFREWFPVFIHNPFVKQIYVYDLFAGSGVDAVGNIGSPLILLSEARGDKKQHCRHLSSSKAPVVVFGFNEKEQQKYLELGNNVEANLKECRCRCILDKCPFENNVHIRQGDFQDLLSDKRFLEILANKEYGKFILLDQYGFSQIEDDVFNKLVESPKTDFIFFIASSFVKRFKDMPAVTAYFDKDKILYDETQPKECHRVIANYFRNLIPRNREYYLHSFTIKKGTNYYGLIFGTNHTFGMEKFLRVCWKEDALGGESNCNINNDYEEGSLFYDSSVSNKRTEVKSLLIGHILSGAITDNITGMKLTMRLGCEPKVFVEVIDELLKEDKIKVDKSFNRASSGVHKVKKYQIEIK